MSSPKTVKRYANRKLYDTERSCYVTLDDISIMIRAGEDVRVVDNRSGEDLTSVTFAQIIFEAEKKKSFMPLNLLRDLIRDGGDVLGEFARDGVDRVQARATEFKETADKLRHEWENRLGGVMRPRPGQDAGDEQAAGEGGLPKPKILSDLLKSAQRAFADLQTDVDQRIRGVSRYAHLDKEMDEISKRLVSLEQRLESLPDDRGR